MELIKNELVEILTSYDYRPNCGEYIPLDKAKEIATIILKAEKNKGKNNG